MILSLSETLNWIGPHLPCQLIPPHTFAAIENVAGFLPQAISASYIECRLSADAERVDFLTCVLASTGGREILSNWHRWPGTERAETFLQHPLWRQLGDFFTLWNQSASLLYSQIPLIWLEFDSDTLWQPIPCPSVHVCIDPEFQNRSRGFPYQTHPNTQDYQEFYDVMFETLLGSPLSPWMRQNIVKCFHALPVDGQALHLSVMLPRQPCVVKINVLIPKDQLLSYLVNIGWPGSMGGIENILETFCAPTKIVKIDITISDSILEAIGFEFFSPPLFGDYGRQALLDRCVENGLCAPEKQKALSTWPGWTRETFYGCTQPIRLSRYLDIKIVSRSAQSLEAKGYLGCMPVASLL